MNYIILFLFLISPACLGENILFFFGGGSYSMKNSAWPWATELAKRGHNITFLSAYSKSPTKDHIGIRDLTSTTLEKVANFAYEVDRFQQRRDHEDKAILTQYSQWSLTICESILLKSGDDRVLQEIIHNDVYDLVIVNVIFGDCGFILSWKYNAKTIVFDGTVPLAWFFDLYGFHKDTSWIPDGIAIPNDLPLTLIDRVTNTFWPLYWYWTRHYFIYPGMEDIMRKAFNCVDVPSFYELEKNTSLIVVNSHPTTDFAYSLPPFVLQIGGMQTFLPENPIPLEYNKFMDESGPGGAVLISFGSTIPLEKLPSEYMHVFFKLMSNHQNIRFLLKWKGPLPKEYESKLHNVYASEWLPQRELLRHPKLKAFITHGGLNSIQEATFYGVPLIVMPLFADQDYNAARIHGQKVGLRLEIRDLTFENFDHSLQQVLYDPQYKQNMRVLSRIFRDRPQSPAQTAAYWTEFVLRNDDVSSLKPMNSHLTWYQRRLLDVYLVYIVIISVALFTIFYILVKITKVLVSNLRHDSNRKKVKTS